MRNRPHRSAKRATREAADNFPRPDAPGLPIEILKPVIPAAHIDGLVPIAALSPYLVVHAPLDESVGAFVRPGDLFEALIDGIPIKGTGVCYPHPADEKAFVEFRIPKPYIDLLADGLHGLSYRITIMPTQETVDSASVPLMLDRVPAGGRCLPRIMFDEAIERGGLSLDTLMALPHATLVGVLPDYVGVDRRDTIHLFMKLRQDGVEVLAGSISPATHGCAMKVSFDRATLDRIEGMGPVDFYYQVLDASGLRSAKSPVTRVDLALKSDWHPAHPLAGS